MSIDRRSLMTKLAPALIGAGGVLAVSDAASAAAVSIDEPGLRDGAEYIESIPDAALESEQAFDAWKKENPVVVPRGAVGCGVAVTTAVVSNVFVASKVLKIRAAIKAAGSAKKFADLLITGFKVAKAEGKSNQAAMEFAAKEASAVTGGEGLAAILELLSVAAVAEKCFGVDL